MMRIIGFWGRANTWGFSPVGLQFSSIGTQLLVFIHIHLVCNVQVCAVEPSLLVIQNLHSTKRRWSLSIPAQITQERDICCPACRLLHAQTGEYSLPYHSLQIVNVLSASHDDTTCTGALGDLCYFCIPYHFVLGSVILCCLKYVLSVAPVFVYRVTLC